jgi:hypothetical protein
MVCLIVGSAFIIKFCRQHVAFYDGIIGVRRGVSKEVQNDRRPLALRPAHPLNGHKATSMVARPQGIEGLGMVHPVET